MIGYYPPLTLAARRSKEATKVSGIGKGCLLVALIIIFKESSG